MKRLLLFLLITSMPILAFAAPIQDKIRAVIATKSVAVSDGEIGTTNHASYTGDTAGNSGYFTIFTTTTAGSVRYGHMYVYEATGGEVACLSLQQDLDGGTVHLSNSGAVTGSGTWLNIDMGSSYTIQAATSYRLTVQLTLADAVIKIGATALDSGLYKRDNGFAYNCGGAMTDDADVVTKNLTIIFNNSAGDPS